MNPENITMAPIAVIAEQLGVGVTALDRKVRHLFLAADEAQRARLAYVKRLNGAALYPVEAVKSAVAPFVPELQALHRETQARMAEERATADARRSAGAARPTKPRKRKAEASPVEHVTPIPRDTRRAMHEPEVYVRRRPGAQP